MPKDPRKDPHSIGNILLKLPSVTEADLERAIVYHRKRDDFRLGESMIELEIITRIQLDAAVMEQQRLKGQTVELLEYATQRTKAVAAGIGSLVTLSTDLVIKLKSG